MPSAVMSDCVLLHRQTALVNDMRSGQATAYANSKSCANNKPCPNPKSCASHLGLLAGGVGQRSGICRLRSRQL